MVKVTPVDIRNQKFGKALRGYDISEVNAFLELVCSTMEELTMENAGLKEKFSSAQSTLKGYTDLEGNLKQALVIAQKTAEEIRENAQKEAQLLMRETQLKAERKMEEAYGILDGLKKKIADLENLKREYLARLKSLVETHLKVLESMEQEDESYKEEPQLAGVRDKSEPNSDEEIEI
jgi:cell division initiation protein